MTRHRFYIARYCRRHGMAAALWAVLLGIVPTTSVAQVAKASGAWSVVDDRGVTVTLAQAPKRIVSLLPSLTETVCALGECAKLVGVDRYSNWPAQVVSIPKVGGGLDPNIEAIVALKPDVVLAATSAKAALRLKSLGIPVVALEPKTLADVHRVWGQLGQLLGAPGAEIAWLTRSAEVAQLTRASSPPRPPVAIYFEVNRGPYAASESSFVGELLNRMQVRNIVPGTLGPYPKLNPEFVVRANPDIIMISASEASDLPTRPGWQSLKAIKNHHVCEFTTAEGDVLVRAGPRLAEAARLIKRCLDRFGNLAPPPEGGKK